MSQKKIELIYFNFGGGHKASALALQQSIKIKYDWDIKLTNLVDVIDEKELYKKITGSRPEDIYNKLLAKGLTAGLAPQLKIIQAGISLLSPVLSKHMSEYWLKDKPDIVVSLIPNFNYPLASGLHNVFPDVPYLTIMTDIADYPPHFWMEKDINQNIICGSEKAITQARELGIPEERIFSVSGMIIRPDFYNVVDIDIQRERQKYNLSKEDCVGLVMFGGAGSKKMLTISEKLYNKPLILICGKNKELAQQLRLQKVKAPRIILEFVDNISYWMKLSNYFIGKPGPGSISEAIQMNLPVIVADNITTMPQEKYNVEWIKEKKLGLVVNSFKHINEAAENLIHNLESFLINILYIKNNAIYEIPKIIEKMITT